MKLVGLAGGSASGKSTIATHLERRLAPRVLVLSQDAYYLGAAETPPAGPAPNFDHPDAVEWPLLIEHLEQLRRGEDVDAPDYDFTRHARREETRRIAPAEIVIVEGILVLSQTALRSRFDAAIYVTTPETTRLTRRIERDVRERGRTEAEIRSQFETTVRPMHEAYVEPQRRWADIVVENDLGPPDALLRFFETWARGLLASETRQR